MTTPTASEPAATVLYEVRHSVSWITLNRPDRLNAWTPRMDQEFFGALETAAGDPEVRVIVVTGAGRGFCAGGDMEELGSVVSGDTTYAGSGRPFSYISRVGKPVIAAINGGCAGIGFALAVMCDLRFAAASAKIAPAFAQRGLVAEHGTSWMLPRIVGHAVAMDLLLSGRKIGADEAHRLGLVNAVHADDVFAVEVEDYARSIATFCSPRSIGYIKHQLFADAEQSFDAAIARADQLTLASHSWPDATEGWKSFVEKRPPRFAPFDGDPRDDR